MDINQWIEDLEYAKPPSELPLPDDQPHATRKRTRGSRTSSLLEPFANRDSQGLKDEQPAIFVGSSEPATNDVTSTSTSSRSSSPSFSSSDKKYKRRSRHHTRADKYHLQSKSKLQAKQAGKKEKEKNPKHTRRKKHKSNAITGLVQSFKAKNVPQTRLTLDPATKFGLYTKGRSSIPTRGKGHLVFSEMRFLQKPESVTKDEPDPNPKKKSRKKKPRQTSEEEISRYFDTGETQPRNEERDQKRHTPPHEKAAAEKDLHTVSPVVSGLLEKPFLGFRSRGTHPPTTSYYSWSESGRESSVRAKHFATDLEPLVAGQLQSSRARKQENIILLKSDTVQGNSTETAVTERQSKNLCVISEHARGIEQASRPPAKSRPVQQTDIEEVPIPISSKHETFAPAATSLAYQSEARSNNTTENLKVPEAALNTPQNDNDYGARSVQSRPTSNHVFEQHSEAWDQLLQSCELAARPLMPTNYDEGLARHGAIATRGQRTPVSYGHADLRLWRTDIDDFPEHDYLDNTALVSEHVGWAQPEAIEHQEDSAALFEETIDDDSEFLDSENGYEFPTEDGVEWNEGDAKQHDAVPGYGMQEGEAIDELAMFWQPNRLY
ncbi:hypothetical protein KCU62_g2111, partial [Aureobasidium sp. EXF-3399]